MALIKCSECSKEKSDKVKKCPNCGFKEKKKISKKLVIIITSIVIVLVAIGVFTFITIDNNNKREQKEYHTLLVETGSKIYYNGLVAQINCYNINKVWYNSIFKKFDSMTDKYTREYLSFIDFSTAINKYLVDKKSILDNLKTKRDEIAKDMLKLKKVPNSNYQDAYDKIIELYGSFNTLVDLSNSPSGAYKDFSSKYNNYSETFDSSYKQLLILVPEIKDYKSE